MALTFGVTVLPDPPASRLVELMKRGEDNGFVATGHGRDYGQRRRWSAGDSPSHVSDNNVVGGLIGCAHIGNGEGWGQCAPEITAIRYRHTI